MDYELIAMDQIIRTVIVLVLGLVGGYLLGRLSNPSKEELIKHAEHEVNRAVKEVLDPKGSKIISPSKEREIDRIMKELVE